MVFATAALLSMGRMTIVRFGCLLLFLLVLAMSESRGAWMIEGALLVCYGGLRILERFKLSNRVLLVSGSAIAALALAVIASMYFPSIALILGRDASLTGRTAIWQQVWIAVLKHPVLGYGFAAFWQGMKGESYNVILALRFVIFHAHNGFLEIWLELGAAGLFLFALSYLRAWVKLWAMLNSGTMRGAFWMIFVLLLVGVYDVDENTLLTFNGLFWILYVAAVANIEIMSMEQRLERRSWSRPMSEVKHVSEQATV
jgi:O-antigen ligase